MVGAPLKLCLLDCLIVCLHSSSSNIVRTHALMLAHASILMVDELDLLVTRRQDVIYNIFDWATQKSSKLIVVAIANTMDLAQRMLPRVASRMGFQHITFSSYTRVRTCTVWAWLCFSRLTLAVTESTRTDRHDPVRLYRCV